jgi:hypothetical protein
LLVAQELGLLGRGLFEGAGGQAAGGGLGDLLHLCQIDIPPGALVAEGTADNDFAPVLGELGDALQIFGSQLPCTQTRSSLRLGLWPRRTS